VESRRSVVRSYAGGRGKRYGCPSSRLQCEQKERGEISSRNSVSTREGAAWRREKKKEGRHFALYLQGGLFRVRPLLLKKGGVQEISTSTFSYHDLEIREKKKREGRTSLSRTRLEKRCPRDRRFIDPTKKGEKRCS